MTYGCIYSLTLFDGRTYVGQTTRDPYVYFNNIYRNKKGIGRRKLYYAICKYGIDSFQFDVIDYAENKEELDKKECYWINAYCCLEDDKGFNICRGGYGPMIGRKHTEQTKLQYSLDRSGEKNPRYGVVYSDELKKKISDAVKLKGFNGDRHPLWGKKHSEETKKKMSKALKGRKSCMEGKHHTLKTKIKNSNPIISEDGSLFFISQTEATKGGYSSARHVVNGKQKSCKGIIFRYATPEEIFEHTGVMV
jgi:hypothetical protein